MKLLAEVERLGHEHLRRVSPVERLARPGVELPSNRIQFVLRESRRARCEATHHRPAVQRRVSAPIRRLPAGRQVDRGLCGTVLPSGNVMATGGLVSDPDPHAPDSRHRP